MSPAARDGGGGVNLEELKQKAEAATPGEWWQLVLGSQEMPFVKFDNPRATLEFQGEWEQGIRDAAFIAAANPQTVLALVKVVEAMNAFIDFLGIIGIEVEEDQETILTERFGAYRMAWDELEAME